jgi:hypothetical protein
MVTEWAIVRMMRMAGNKEGNDMGGKGNGNSNEECDRNWCNNIGDGYGDKGGG